MGNFVYVLGIVLLFYVLFISPQKKQQARRNELNEHIRVGEEIYTVGGILGKITEVGDQTLKLDVGNGVEIEFLKTAVFGTKADLIKNNEEVSIDDLDEYMDDAEDANAEIEADDIETELEEGDSTSLETEENK